MESSFLKEGHDEGWRNFALLKRRAELASSSFTTATGQDVMAAAWDNAFRFQPQSIFLEVSALLHQWLDCQMSIRPTRS